MSMIDDSTPIDTSDADYPRYGQTPPSTNARDMMQDRSNSKVGDFQKRIRQGRAAAQIPNAQAKNFADGGAIDDGSDQGESWQPAAGPPVDPQGESWQQPAISDQEGPPAPAAQPQAQAAAPGQTLPNMGPPPVFQTAAQSPANLQGAGQVASAAGQAIGNTANEALQNTKNDPMVKRIISYLQGGDAAAPETIDQVGQKADPQGQMSPAERNVAAVHTVAQGPGGQDAAWRLVQANRVAYNAKLAFAKVALDGTEQKPANIHSAIDAANQATPHLLDGSNVRFAASQGGVTATVQAPGTNQIQRIPLSMDQFKQFVDVGTGGQWDKVREHGVATTLTSFAKAQGSAPADKDADQAPAPQDAAPADIDSGKGGQMSNAQLASGNASRTQTTFGHTPSSMNISGSEAPNPQNVQTSNERSNYGPELEARAQARFPSASQNADRQAYMATEEEKELERTNRIDVATEKGKQATERARVTGQAHVQGAQVTADARVKSSAQAAEARKAATVAKVNEDAAKEERLDRSSQRAAKLRALTGKISTGAKLEPGEQAYWDKQYAATPEVPAPAPQANNPSARGANVGQRAQAPVTNRSSQDTAALQWANAHPADPRAAQIHQRLGTQ